MWLHSRSTWSQEQKHRSNPSNNPRDSVSCCTNWNDCANQIQSIPSDGHNSWTNHQNNHQFGDWSHSCVTRLAYTLPVFPVETAMFNPCGFDSGISAKWADCKYLNRPAGLQIATTFNIIYKGTHHKNNCPMVVKIVTMMNHPVIANIHHLRSCTMSTMFTLTWETILVAAALNTNAAILW